MKNVFFWNPGDSSRRGVWHLAKDGTLNIETISEKRRAFVDEYIDWGHGVSSELCDPDVNYYKSWERYPNSSQSDKTAYPIIGSSTSVLVTPEHKKYVGESACGSGVFHGNNAWSINYGQTTGAKKNIGKDLGEIATHRIGRLHVQFDGEPPEPFCRHCLRIYEANLTDYERDVRESPLALRDEDED